ncbi:MAG: hypothetical protein HQK79_17560 [Desulfobacterales bacterium]|nr:hypothetical protein [Desulfobacterales bacterium]
MNKLLEMILSEAVNIVENRLGSSNIKSLDFSAKEYQGQSAYNSNCNGGRRGRGGQGRGGRGCGGQGQGGGGGRCFGNNL